MGTMSTRVTDALQQALDEGGLSKVQEEAITAAMDHVETCDMQIQSMEEIIDEMLSNAIEVLKPVIGKRISQDEFDGYAKSIAKPAAAE